MPIASTENLYHLVKSLSKAEKRSFKLYARRNQVGEELLFLKLFDALDKSKGLDERELRRKLGTLSGAAFSNLKKHLYEQVMISLRLLKRDKQQNIKIREYIDFSYVLYGKGLHMQALEVLEKAKKLSTKHFNDFSLLTIIEMEKMIHSRHITRSKSEPIIDLIMESEMINRKVSSRVELSNIRLRLHKIYVENGHVHNMGEELMLREEFEEDMANIDVEYLDGLELIYYYQSYVWYYYILDDFKSCLGYALKWVQVFRVSEEMKKRDIDLFMRGYHYILTAAFNINDVTTYKVNLQELELLRKNEYSRLNLNSQIVSFQYVHKGRMNLHFMLGSFDEGIKNVPNTLKRIHRYQNKLDVHKVMVIYYKVAWMYLGSGNYNMAIDNLERIMAMTDKSLRSDIQCYARLMYLMAQFEGENFEVVIENSVSISRYFDKQENINQVQLSILAMMKELAKAPLLHRKSILKAGYNELDLLKDNKYEKRAFVYLDIMPWIVSKCLKVSLGDAISKRMKM